ncbi:MAG: LysM peptidoglycan-binding domain-containing protein [Actinobacteria bacterium]|nr:LysM peptidoglycan-binding domain-containing protein [Actinomycetota bacterium]MCG2797191.1 LysM peptidoglycan-binding domain-containing protein [Cellulomonas sp.]
MYDEQRFEPLLAMGSPIHGLRWPCGDGLLGQDLPGPGPLDEEGLMTTITMSPALSSRALSSRALSGRVAPTRLRRGGHRDCVQRDGGARDAQDDVPLRLTRRGRLVLLALCAVVLVIASVLVSGLTASAGAPASAPVVERHVVASGETLWEIASSISRPGQDVRDVILEVVQLNELPDSGLVAGQTIVLPVQG